MTNNEALGKLTEAIWGTLSSPNEVDSNYEDANVVDALCKIARAIDRHAAAMENLAKALSNERVAVE